MLTVAVLQCKGNLVPHESPKGIACCDDVDLCNEQIEPTVVYRSTTFIPGGMLHCCMLCTWSTVYIVYEFEVQFRLNKIDQTAEYYATFIFVISLASVEGL